MTDRWNALSAAEKVAVIAFAPVWVPFFALLALFVYVAMAMEAVERLLWGEARDD